MRSLASRGFSRRRRGDKSVPTPARVLARAGCVSVGCVYGLIGVQAMLALLQLAAPAADEQRILQRLQAMPSGNAVVAALALGTVAYISWLLYEAVFDPYGFGRTYQGLVERLGTAASAAGYAVIVSAGLRVLSGTGHRGEEKQEALVASILEWTGGRWLIGVAGVIVAVAGVCQLKYVYDGEHRRRLRVGDESRIGRVLVDLLGWTGYGARCAILLVVASFLLRAAWSFAPEAVGDTDSAFDFLGLGGRRWGDALFSAVAIGTINYGILMVLTAIFFAFEPRDDG